MVLEPENLVEYCQLAAPSTSAVTASVGICSTKQQQAISLVLAKSARLCRLEEQKKEIEVQIEKAKFELNLALKFAP
jgi:hypothetical protein